MKEIGLKYQMLAQFKLLAEGFVISETLGDYSPYDLICDWNGCISRLQIRSTHRRLSQRNRGYKLQCNKWRGKKEILTKEDCDFIIAIAGKNDCCYVIPIGTIKQKTILLHPDKDTYKRSGTGSGQESKMKWEQYENQWGLLK